MAKGKVEQVKGEAIVAELGWVKHKKGEAGLSSVFEDINAGRPPHARLALADFKDENWYPVEMQYAVLKSIEKRFGGGKADILREVGAYGVRNITKFSFFIRFMNPHAVGDKLAGSITLLYRTLAVGIKHPDDHSMAITISGFPVDRVYSMLMKGGIEQIMRYLKVAEPSVEEQDCADAIKILVRWK